MKRLLRRMFSEEIEILQGLSFRLGIPALRKFAFRKDLRRRRPASSAPAPPFRAGGAAAGRPGPPGLLRTLAIHRTGILSTLASILFHACLLAFLAKVYISSGEGFREEPKSIQISLILPGRTPLSPPSAKQAPLEEASPPADPPAPPGEKPPPDSPPEPLPGPAMENPPEQTSDDEPGFPGTGTEPKPVPEGSPGPPAVLGVGSSPPPGDGRGLGGEGEGTGIGGRTKGRAAGLGRYGGNSATEDAVSRGLAWLAAHQDLDGGWSAANFNLHCHHFTQCVGKGLEEFDTGLTALCVLAFLGAGQSPSAPGPYQRNVERALDKIISDQGASGVLGFRGDRYLYNHSIATFALCEAYSFDRESKYLKPVLAALNFTYASQQPGGGWDYTDAVTGRNDLSITGWQVMALRAALAAGIPVPQEVLGRIRGFLRSAILPGGEAVYANKGMAAGRRGINMTAVALLSLLYLDADPRDSWIQTAADRLMLHPPEPEAVPQWETYHQSSYYWYAATLCLFHLGGKRWEAWNHFLQKKVLPLQIQASHEGGSWPPDGNWLGALGGRVFTTAMNVLTFEVYYRYPPLHTYGKIQSQ